MFRLTSLALGAIIVTAACADPAMEQRLQDLEEKIVKLEEKAAAAPAAAAGAQADPGEAAAADLLRKASEQSEGGNYEEAKATLAELKSKYGATRAARAAERLALDLEVIGQDAPTLATQMWYQGETTVDGDDVALLVFWEVWCPHCKREVPKLQSTFDKFNSKGLKVIGLTKQSRDTTDEQVSEFISSNNVTYPMAREEGDSMSKAYNVRGVPSAAVVKAGKVVWKGHPARLTDQMLEGWL